MISGPDAPRLRRFVSFSRASEGAIAVEFALLALPFFILLFLALEMAGNYLLFQQVERIGQVAAQGFRSGTLVTRDYSADSFRTNVLCPQLVLVSCDKLVVNLGGLDGPRLTSSDVSGAGWCTGGSQQVRILQIAHPVPFISRLWAGDVADGNPYFISTHGLRNAPGILSGDC